MCDEIDPKHVWQKNVQFPRLRDKTLVNSDFFEEDKEGFRTSANKDMYDLVIGNAWHGGYSFYRRQDNPSIHLDVGRRRRW